MFHVTLSMEEPFASNCISLEPQNLKKPKTLAPQFYIIKCFTMIEVASYQGCQMGGFRVGGFGLGI